MILFLYVFRSYFKYVAGIMALTTFMFILFDFIHKSTRYLSRYQPETQHLVSYYFYQLPNLFIQGLPIASLLSSVITMVLLSRTNEVTAMRAVGLGPIRIGAPIAVGGALICLVSFLLGEFVLPHTSKRMHYIQSVLIEKNKEFSGFGGSKWVRDSKTLVNFEGYNRQSQELSKVRVIYTGKSFRPKRTIEADRATFDEAKGKWKLMNVKVLYFWPNGTLSYTEKRPEHFLSIPVQPGKMNREQRFPNEMSSSELGDIINLGESSGADVLDYRVDLEVKFAFHFASFVVSLIGLKFGFKSERSMESAKSILLAIGMGISYWFILNAGRALGKRGALPPFFAAWLANIIVFSFSWYSVMRARKS